MIAPPNFIKTASGAIAIGILLAIFLISASAQTSYSVVHRFRSFTVPNGAQPQSPPILGPDGNLYGTASVGGSDNQGVVYRITPSGTVTILHNFGDGSVANDGLYAIGSLVLGSDSNFYGVASNGGSANRGAAFRMTASGTVTTLHSFGDGSVPNDGQIPCAALILGSDLNFYGVTEGGGSVGQGALYRMTPSGVVTILHSFSDGSTANDGRQPNASLVQGSDGALYGPTFFGGAANGGTLYRYSSTGAYSILHSFRDGSVANDGEDPEGPLVLAGNGSLYGTTELGGAYSGGAVYELTAAGTVTTVHSFGSSPGDGAISEGGLIVGHDGSLYGTTVGGGSHGYGTIYRMTVSGTESVFYSFTGKNYEAQLPQTGLVQGADGTFYGATYQGGLCNAGAVYQVTSAGTYSTLYDFGDIAAPDDGALPRSGGLVIGGDGNYYGTTLEGGSVNEGAIFKLTPAGVVTTVHSFDDGSLTDDGTAPFGGLILGSDGNYYGATDYGGAASAGVVYKMSPSGVVTILHDFGDGSVRNDGLYGVSSLVEGSDGNYYGTTGKGGSTGLYGAVYRITPAGVVTILHSFLDGSVSNDGSGPLAALIIGPDHNYYGTTIYGGAAGLGTIYRMTPAGAVTILHSFGDGTVPFDGEETGASLLLGPDGNFYGTTFLGGLYGLGTAFVMTPTGDVTILHSFGQGIEGSKPDAPLVLGGDGNFYGTTEQGGTLGGGYGNGSVFMMTPSGTVTTLHNFEDGSTPDDGSEPYAALLRVGSNFYGTTGWGATQLGDGIGTVFEIIGPAVPPTTTATLSGAAGASPWYLGSVTVTLSAKAGSSPVAGTYDTVDGTSQITYSAPFTVSGDAVHTITFWSVDTAGLTEKSNSMTISIDSTPPVTTESLVQALNVTTVTLSASDNLSGIGATYYTVDGGSQQTYTAAFPITPAGQHTLTFWSVDVAGNVEPAHTADVIVKGAPPTTTWSLSGPAGLYNWYTGPVSVTLSASANSLPVANTYYTIDGGAQQTYTAPFAVSADKHYAITYWSVDLIGDTEPANFGVIAIDGTPPVTTSSVSQAVGASTVALDATDDFSGVAATYYTVDGGAAQLYLKPFVVSPAGKHAMAYWSVDVAGNVETAHAQPLVVVASPPTTTASLSGPAGRNNWYTGAVTVTLAAASALPVASTYYTVDGRGQQIYTTPFPVSGDGKHTIAYWSVDTIGDTEQTENTALSIDATAPSLLFGSLTPAPNGAGWNTGPVSIPYTTSDGTSGVASSAPGSPLLVTAEGAMQTRTVVVTDIAGNSATFTSPPVSIDLTPPITTASASEAVGTTTVTLTATDNLSGVATSYYTLDGAAQESYSAPIVITASGSHSVSYWSVDAAGNVETAHAMTVTVDAATAATKGLLSGPVGLNGWYTGPVTVDLTAAAGSLPVAATYYTLDGGTRQTYSAPFVVSGDAAHALQYWSVDGAGLSEPIHTQAIDIDGTPPTITVGKLSPAANAAGWSDSPVSISYTVTDNCSGVASSSPGSPLSFSKEGANQSDTITALDLAGNSAKTASPVINIDVTPPVTSASFTQAIGKTSITLTAADNLSGVAATYYSIDGGEQQAYTAPIALATAGSHSVRYWSVDLAGNTEAAHVLPVSVQIMRFGNGMALISLPYDYSGISPDAVFGYAGVKLAVWNPTAIAYAVTPTSPADAVRLGVGYWINVPAGGASVATTGTPADPAKDYPINLVKGWNQIGDPFLTSVPLSSAHFTVGGSTVTFSAAVSSGSLYGSVYEYDGGGNGYSTVTSLSPGVGNWIYAYTAGVLAVPHG